MGTLSRAMAVGLCAAAVGVGAAGAANAGPAAGPTVSQQDQNFLSAAHQTNMAEIALSARAAAMSSCPAIRDLAPMLVRDHTRLDGMVTTVAARYGVMLPMMPDSDQMRTLMVTVPKMGRDFDINWLRAQESGHLAALSAGNQEVATGQSADVRILAEQAGPIVQGHLDAVRAALGTC
ncbi:DUF4142 domain-containing protein [Nocardia arthritidis]|uniref:DUF4142 domain-containing protein n=1 Tax=Nocardia arthritidis TaxID=228602 RepID=A0A6G9YRF2_9NOCA|nr:DUF4142 domain-containing protein [Nocardia arthritidis]QIS15792.1 DUF4142 domain-containing protein [Nocardia arthritidis]